MAKPMYQRIAQDLRQEIESGKLRPGAKLPTELELRERYNISHNTIRDAIKRLASLNMIETRPGQGTFVAEPLAPFFTTLSADVESRLGGSEGHAALSEIKAMGLTPSADTSYVGIERADRMLVAEQLGVSQHDQIQYRWSSV
jgi:GntR family transcriptional regulator